ncbi:hypothetical protein D3C72_769690 [compost metagenome]
MLDDARPRLHGPQPLDGLAHDLHVQHAVQRKRRRGGSRVETQPAEKRPQLAQELLGRLRLTGPNQPSRHQKRPFFRDIQAETARIEHGQQRLKTVLAEVVVREDGPGVGHLGRIAQLRQQALFARQQGSLAAQSPRDEASVHDLGRHPGGHLGDRRTRSDGQRAVLHPRQHPQPVLYTALGIPPHGRVRMRLGRVGGLEQLPEGKSRVRGGHGLLAVGWLPHRDTPFRVPVGHPLRADARTPACCHCTHKRDSNRRKWQLRTARRSPPERQVGDRHLSTGSERSRACRP